MVPLPLFFVWHFFLKKTNKLSFKSFENWFSLFLKAFPATGLCSYSSSGGDGGRQLWGFRQCSWFPEPNTSFGSGAHLAKHWAEAADLCAIQINFHQWTVSGLWRMWYRPKHCWGGVKKKISTSIKITKGLQRRLYPRYRVTFFSFFCNNINKSWDKTAYLKHLTGDFYCAQLELGTQTITFPLHNGLIFMAQVALGLSWMCTLPSPGFVPALEPSTFLCAF